MTAQPIACTNGDGNLAALLVTNLGNGDTTSWCAGCIPGWARMLADTLDPPTTPTVDAEAPQTPQEANGEGGRPGAPRPRKRAAQPATVPAGADDQTPGEPADDAAPDER